MRFEFLSRNRIIARQVVTRAALDYLAAATRAGATLTGVADGTSGGDNEQGALPSLRIVA
jgi:hypothetical protein